MCFGKTISQLGFCVHRNQQVFVGPMGQVEEGTRRATDAGPFDAADLVHVRSTEVERTSIEQDGTPAVVCLPESSAIRASLIEVQQVAVHIDVPESQHAVLVDNEFLIHNRLDEWITVCETSDRHTRQYVRTSCKRRMSGMPYLNFL